MTNALLVANLRSNIFSVQIRIFQKPIRQCLKQEKLLNTLTN
jgi:hypothetical protein